MNKNIIIISGVLVLIFSIGSASGTWYFMNQNSNQKKVQLEKDKGNLESKIKELDKKISAKENNKAIVNNNYVNSNYFDPIKTKVGDKIADMTIKEIKPFFNDRPNVPIGYENAKVSFEGEVTIEGEITYYKEDEAFLGNNICVNTFPWGEKNPSNLPTVEKNGSSGFFCFDSSENTSKLLGISKGETIIATVTIDNLVLNSCGCEAVDRASLKKIISRKHLVDF